MTYTTRGLPNALIWRRLHSLTGFMLVLYLIEHLLTNSQAGLFFGEDASGFIETVNGIHALPFVQVIEIALIGIPLLVHGFWGIRYALTSKSNSYKTDGRAPSLEEYPRNKNFTWQRITSWILLVGIAAHTIQMRFLEYPSSVGTAHRETFMVKLQFDPGLYTLSERLGVKIYDQSLIQNEENALLQQKDNLVQSQQQPIIEAEESKTYDPKLAKELIETQEIQIKEAWLKTLKSKSLKEGEVMAVAPTFGAASLLIVRDTFKNLWMCALYTILVISATFHAFNGFWTFLISWGVTLTARSQEKFMWISQGLMVIVSLLGLAAIWGTYWINLRA